MDETASISTTSPIGAWVAAAMESTPILDLHTHIYPPAFGSLLLWGIDELLTYHYLVGESIRASRIQYEAFWGMSKTAQADFVWKTLFIDRAPISEACRGVLTVLKRLALDAGSRKLDDYRDYFKSQTTQGYVDQVLSLANVREVVMTNDPFDPVERAVWMNGPEVDPRFKAVLRVDSLLLGWPTVSDTFGAMGYAAHADLGSRSLSELRRFLNDWIDRMGAIYVAVSLPPTWKYPDNDPATRVLEGALLPVARERNLPVALMIGVARQANPQLRLAGDSLGRADLAHLNRLCEAHPQNRFLATLLSRENQHELAVAARLFPNLFVFGCWWYLNNPSLVEEITRLRVEMLGESFAPQHSDARVLDQLIYKWDHSRHIIAKVLTDKFSDLAATGWLVTQSEIARTAEAYLAGNFEQFIADEKGAVGTAHPT